jgi:hypothetical protein
MTLSVCDQVAERTALGEPLAELAEHVEACASCRSLVEVSSKLGATRHAVDPGLGFSARMTVGAQHRISARRRRRVTVGLAATVVAGGLSVLFVARTPEPVVRQPTIALPIPAREPIVDEEPAVEELPAEDDDIAALMKLADVERNTQISANWGDIEKPLAPYKKLLEEEAP